jgi:diadenosine tetraphosphate (Ap4A) HIT family hydrolase
MSTIFSKIIAGEIPCHKVYEDDRVLAFLDINPLSEGHTLVIPKEEVATLDALSDESAAAIGRVLPRLCRAVMQATGAKDYNILQNNGAAAHQAGDRLEDRLARGRRACGKNRGAALVTRPGGARQTMRSANQD